MKNLLIGALLGLSLLFVSGCKTLRESVGPKVVRITTSQLNHGGTGVHVKVPSGRTYILTNRHICRLAEGGQLWVGFDDSRPIPRRVLDIDPINDLCLVEPLPDIEGIEVGSREPKKGDLLTVLGFPQLLPLIEAEGHYIAEHDIDVVQFEVSSDAEAMQCSAPNQRIEKISFLGIFEISLCISRNRAGLVTAIAYGGNSGSPILDGRGRLVGLLYAGSDETHWAEFVLLRDIHKFLLPY